MDRIYNYFDIEGGDQNLSGYAFPAVYKHDASGFYNWEEDNLPINDLETRSDVFKQYLGLDTSLTGVTLTVSADAPKSASSVGVYQTVQQALEVVPRRVRIPVLIEICDFGDLGDLEIKDIQGEGDGGLQITCRQYLEDFGVTGPTLSASYTYGPSALQSMPTELTAAGFQASLYAVSSTRLGISCSASEPWDRHGRMYVQKRNNSQDEVQTLCYAPWPRANGVTFSGTTVNTFNFEGYSELDDITVREDANPMAGSIPLIEERLPLLNTDSLMGVAYGASFRKIKISNCSRVKLKNVCVDSASGADFTYPNNAQFLCDRGLDIRNSNVLLENVAVSRFRKTGIYMDNSTVSTAKHFFVHRIYDRTVNQTRESNGVGVYSVDSNLIFDTSSTDTASYAANSAGAYINSISKCGIGIEAINSQVGGGARSSDITSLYPKNAGGIDFDTTHITCFGNETGIRLENSILNYDGRPSVFCNIKGVDAFQSNITLPQFSIDYNQDEGVYLSKSGFQYGNFSTWFAAYGSCSATLGSDKPKPAYCADYNGINIHSDKGSSISPAQDCSAILNLDMWGGSYSGTGQNTITRLAMSNHNAAAPSILISDNSNGEFVQLVVATPGVNGGVGGKCARAEKNSTLTIRGTSKGATGLGSYGTINSLAAMERNWTTAATCADGNSKITFSGPTKISRYGIAVLAVNNSEASFGPPITAGESAPNGSLYGLDSSSNHTMIDLHANRACVVASNKSTISMESLGGSSLTHASSVDSKSLSALSGLYTSATSGSFVRFCPNGFTENAIGTLQVEAGGFDTFTRTSLSGAPNDDHPDISTGGMCVRAVGASQVNANLVNFKFGMNSSSVSGVMYNYNGTGCEYDGLTTSGGPPSLTSNICDLVTSCCDVDTATTTSTTATTAATAATTPTDATTLAVTTVTDATTTLSTTLATTTLATTTLSTESSTTTTTPPTIQYNLPKFDVGGANVINQGTLATQEENFDTNDIDFSCVGSRVHLWNIADTSRLHASNLLINRLAPETACVGSTWHGPTGRWHNGAACDYYGKYGFAASTFETCSITAGSVDGFYNLGIFRIVGSNRGYLKSYTEVAYDGYPIRSQYFGGGSPLDQCGGQGYQTMFDTAIDTFGIEDVSRHVGLEYGSTSGTEPVFGRGLAGLPYEPGKMNGLITHAPMTEGAGMLWDLGQLHPHMPVPPLHLGWQGYMRNWVDESAANVFANTKHATNKKVNLVSIYRSTTSLGGEGRDTLGGNPTYGVGVRSLNMFDLDRLV